MIYHGDCLDILPTLEAESVDSIVTDPPYGLSFMGKSWDHGVPGVPFWEAALRVAKPGAFLLAFGGTRTHHRLMVAIEDAGWEIRDVIGWLYGSGFPKSLDVSKAIDKAVGAERLKIATGNTIPDIRANNYENSRGKQRLNEYTEQPATDAARQWEGWGTALKPAWEPIIVARKPLVGTVAQNVLKYGTGGLNIDGCRVETSDTYHYDRKGGNGGAVSWRGLNCEVPADSNLKSRWPANIIHDGSEEVLGLFPQSSVTGNRKVKNRIQQEAVSTPFTRSQDAPEYTDAGSAARFFYCAKASKQDRDMGCEGLEAIYRVNGNKWIDQDYRCLCGERPPSAESGPRRNHHPTVKPTALMRYLCRLVTPPNGVILDPFMGSGSTGKAAKIEVFRFIGIEIEKEYCGIAEKRITSARLPLLEEK